MELQYLSDNNGKHTAIVIPIEDWEILTKKHKDLKLLESKPVKQKNKKKLSEIFAGSLKLTDKQYNEFQESVKQSRNEWEKNTY